MLVVGRTNLPRFIDIWLNTTFDRLCSYGAHVCTFTVFIMNLILDFVLRNFVTCNMIIAL